MRPGRTGAKRNRRTSVGPKAEIAEQAISERDPALGAIIAGQPVRWSQCLADDVAWGLMKLVISQQVSTTFARRLIMKVERQYGPFPERLNHKTRMLVDVLRRF